MAGERLIDLDKSVVTAVDVDDVASYRNILLATADNPKIGAHKIGFNLGLEFGLGNVVGFAKDITQTPIIYDHQKAGNDIPEMGSKFAQVCARAGVDAVILFPFSSPVTERDWIRASQDAGLRVLVGGHMTHQQFLHSEGGYIADDAPERIYRLAADEGVRDFVVPGNKIGRVRQYREILDSVLGVGNFALYAPGFITQGGQISDFAKEAGARWHAIVGSAIYKAQDMKSAALEMTSQI